MRRARPSSEAGQVGLEGAKSKIPKWKKGAEKKKTPPPNIQRHTSFEPVSQPSLTESFSCHCRLNFGPLRTDDGLLLNDRNFKTSQVVAVVAQ